MTGIKRLLADVISANGFSFTDGQKKSLGLNCATLSPVSFTDTELLDEVKV